MWVMTAVSTLASAALAGVLLVAIHRESVRQQLQATAASLVTLGMTQFSELRDFEELNRFIEDALQMERIDKIIRVYDASRELIFTTAGADYDSLPDRLQASVARPVFLTIAGAQRRYESLVMPYEGEGSKKTYYLQVAIPLPRYADMLESLWWQSIVLFGLLIGISILLSHVVSSRLLMPVRQIADALQRMDPGTIDAWTPLVLDRRSRYLAAIAEGINLLAERTGSAMAQLSKMGRYVAHEMRTPLTILRGEAEMVLAKPGANSADYERVLKSSLEEIERMSEIVDTVLHVGESARPTAADEVDIDLEAWLRDHVPEWEKTLGRSIDLDISLTKAAVVRADPRLFSRLIDNLVRNVRHHTPREARCAIFAQSTPGGVEIVIADNGSGLSSEAIASLNQRGGYSEAAGVGLNLCHRIAEICGIEMVFSHRTGGGLGVTMRIPRGSRKTPG